MVLKRMKICLSVSRIFLGLLFVFSGFVKVVDPWGTAYKFTDYFTAFGWDFFYDFALVFSVLLSVAELLIGICLLLRLKMKVTTMAALSFMVFFTLLTLWIALTNPVSDCGCFGDAIKLGNWETFIKNLIMLPIAIFLFTKRNHISHFSTSVKEWIYVCLFGLYGVGISVYSYLYLPIIDFLPYYIGQNIPQAMSIPKEKENDIDVYDITLIYEKDGVQHHFTQDSFMKSQLWSDTTWKYVDTKTVLVKEGYKPPIAHLTLNTVEGINILDSVLHSGNFFWGIVRNANKLNQSDLEKLEKIAVFAQQNKVGFYLLTSSALDQMQQKLNESQWSTPIYFTDDTELKSMLRANVGLIYINHGIISGKWSNYEMPIFSTLEEIDNLSFKANNKQNTDVLVAILIGVVLWVVVFSMEQLYKKHRKN